MSAAAPPAVQSTVRPFVLLWLPVVLTAASLQAFAATSVQLKSSAGLSSVSPLGKPSPGPTFVEAESITGHNQQELVAEGQVVMRNLRERLEADWLRYDQPADLAEARGHVVFMRERDRIQGSVLKLKLESRLGEMKDVAFLLYSNDGKRMRGEAESLIFAGPDVYHLNEASYTTCPPGNLDWLLKMDNLELDYVKNLGTARHVRVEYMNVPILYAPWMDFALDGSRKSGFLTPSFGASDARGLEWVTPWYWNIAPQRDATFTPRVMTDRGIQLGGEFRYLEPDYSGELSAEILPNDRASDSSRYRVLLRHRQQLGARWAAGLDYDQVSDDQYFSDLSSQVSQTSQVNLPQQLSLQYTAESWKASGLLQSYQTLQDASAAYVVEPYSRLPQLRLTATRDFAWGDARSDARSDVASGKITQMDSLTSRFASRFDLNSELVYFDHPGASRVQGTRLHANPSLSLPFQTPFSVVTPRVGWYLSHYALDEMSRTLADSLALPETGRFDDSTRSLPMFSLDSSLFLERDMNFRGDSFTQTLEPRLYYVYIPYRDQRGIPVFDSSVRELSLDQLFAENQYIGVDRINDANQLTLAVTTRFLDQGSGAERLQLTLGQRYHFTRQQVTLPGLVARSGNSTELLALVSGQINARLNLNAGIQVDTGEGNVSKASLGGAWRDGPGRLFNADYRYTQDLLNQVDVSFQWPLAAKWYGLGRVNYSIKDSSLVEGLVGFEYNAGCWSLRGVMQHLATTEATATNAFFLQLELRGLTKLGPNPLDILKRSITGYAQSSEISE